MKIHNIKLYFECVFIVTVNFYKSLFMLKKKYRIIDIFSF